MDVKQLEMWSYFMLLVVPSCWRFTNGQQNTIQFELGFSRPSNNTVLLMNAIGFNQTRFTGDPLACTTQLVPCCHTLPDRHGHWFYPNGTEVPIEGEGYSFYRYRRDSRSGGERGGALLNRRFGAMAPTGIFRCVIPDARRVNQTLYIGLYTDSNDNGAELDPINFAIASGSDQFVSFSLTCASNGGPVATMRWQKDGTPVPGSTIYPDLTDPEMATYSNTLQVTNGQPGVYTCTATDGDTLSLSQSYTVEAANPPTDVSANLNTISGPLIITWSPPASGGAEVTGYRIYYNLGCLSLDVVVAKTENRYEMGLNGLLPDDIMSVSVRAESTQLPSELVMIRISVRTDVLATTTTEELTIATTKIVSDVNGMGTVTTNVNGMGTATETDGSRVSTSDDGIAVLVPTTGPVGVVIDGLQPRRVSDDPLLIVAIIEGAIIVILIIILIVVTALLIRYRARVHSMLRQTSQKIDQPSPHDLQSECGTQSTEKLVSQLQITDV